MARKPRSIRIDGPFAFITLTKGYEAVIDAEDIPTVDGYHWHACVQPHTVYAKTNMRSADGVRVAVYLHRHIMQPSSEACVVDHRDGDGLNNRRRGDGANLRVSTRAENQRNQKGQKQTVSGLKGVSKHHNGWRARIMLGGTPINLGTFKTPDGAHAAYCQASDEMHGEFGRHA